MYQFSSVQFSRSVMSDSLRPHELQHARPPCPSPTPGVYPNTCSLSWCCHPAISSSVTPFSSCPQSSHAYVYISHTHTHTHIYVYMLIVVYIYIYIPQLSLGKIHHLSFSFSHRGDMGFPGGTSGKESTCQCKKHKRCRFSLWVGKIPWRRVWKPTPIILPSESQG